MNGKQLKNSILQMAIQGKLVPQNPADEPASELLKRIRAEKEALVKAGKLKKKDLTTTPISDEEKPFELPKGWEWCRLGELCSFLSRGKSPSYSDAPNNYPVFAQKCNLKDGGISLDQARFLNPATLSKWPEEYKLQTGDVLINSTGTGTVCRTRLFHSSYLGKYPFTFPDSHVSVARTFDEVNSSFIYYLFNSKTVQDFWEDNLAGSTNQKELYIGLLQSTVIPLPPLAEQKRIVEKIEELMPLVEDYDKAQAQLDNLNAKLPDALKKSILQEAIMGKLVPQDENDEPASELLKRIRAEKEALVKAGKLKKKDLVTTPISDEEKPFDIPESWEWCRLGEISNFNGGFAFQSHKYIEKGIRVLRISDFNENGINSKSPVYYEESEMLNKYLLSEGDILMCMTGGTVGKCCKVSKLECPTYVNQRVADIKINKLLQVDYVYNIIRGNYIQSIINESKNSTNDNISAALIQSFVIPLPPLAEQKRIVEKIEELFALLK